MRTRHWTIYRTTEAIKIQLNPSNEIMKEVELAIKNSSLDEEVKSKLAPKNCMVPWIYELPKIPKENAPLRPIMNTIGSHIYKLVKCLAKRLRNMVGKAHSCVKGSTHMIKEIRNTKVDEQDLLVSFNVVSLFTKILVDNVIKNITDEETVNPVKVCFKLV